jgi:hypothetical protein
MSAKKYIRKLFLFQLEKSGIFQSLTRTPGCNAASGCRLDIFNEAKNVQVDKYRLPIGK